MVAVGWRIRMLDVSVKLRNCVFEERAKKQPYSSRPVIPK
jgi:hypothetical protein